MMTIEKSAAGARRGSVSAAVRRALSSAGTMSLALTVLAGAAAAQEQLEQGASQDDSIAVVTVTGTRIVRDGYEAPTPLTVMGVEELQAQAPVNIADVVNQMPSVAGSITPANSQTSISSGGAGINALNLRGLGSVRTLVLLNGQRSVGSALTGVVDVNNFPQQLIERVDVVTGGASSAYGSDAVSGVVNFVLDTDFTGFKTEVMGGITDEGDDDQYKVSAAFGTPFASDRGHLLFSGEYSSVAGVINNDRDWNQEGWKTINNPAYVVGNGEPERLVVNQVAPADATLGGIVTAGVLPGGRTGPTAARGTYFGPGGATADYQYGQYSAPFSVGGANWQDFNLDDFISLDPEQTRRNLFGRLSFELTDSIEIYGQALWAQNDIYVEAAPQFNIGNITIQRDNAFIPASVLAELEPTYTGFRLGTFHGDLPPIIGDNERTVTSYVLGLNGRFGDGWSWDLYYQMGTTDTRTAAPGAYNRANFSRAIDAVRDPAGNIVCRSTLQVDPADGCVAFNVMGIGVNSPEAIAYVLGAGGAWREEEFTQDVAAFSVQGEPFSSWAGPVSMATGVEWRQEEVSGVVDPDSLVNNWFVGNYLPTFGEYDVTEGFLETVVPLAADLPWAETLDLNGAVRLTDYSTSGSVETWKIGAIYSPIPDITFRATRSRDIRAPNLEELFQAGGANTNNVVDPFNGNQTVQYQGFRVGNPNLQPEEADTIGVGIVLQPSFAPGLSASVDYYEIDIGGAIGAVDPQEIVDRCFTGNQEYCDAITRGPGPGGVVQIQRIRIQPFNLVTRTARGIDVEASYRLPMTVWGGDLSFRALMTRYLENYENNGINAPTDSAGQNSSLGSNGPPDWLARVTAGYTNDRLSVSLSGRGISSGVYDNSFIECTSGCPISTTDNRTINNNHIDGAFYLDGSASYTFQDIGVFSDLELFLSIRNIFDKDPAVVAGGPGGTAFSSHPVNPTYYDYLGRTFRAGFRMSL